MRYVVRVDRHEERSYNGSLPDEVVGQAMQDCHLQVANRVYVRDDIGNAWTYAFPMYAEGKLTYIDLEIHPGSSNSHPRL